MGSSVSKADISKERLLDNIDNIIARKNNNDINSDQAAEEILLSLENYMESAKNKENDLVVLDYMDRYEVIIHNIIELAELSLQAKNKIVNIISALRKTQ